jgi:hypothetical protein
VRQVNLADSAQSQVDLLALTMTTATLSVRFLNSSTLPLSHAIVA